MIWPLDNWLDFWQEFWSCSSVCLHHLISFMAAVKRSVPNCSELVLILGAVVKSLDWDRSVMLNFTTEQRDYWAWDHCDAPTHLSIFAVPGLDRVNLGHGPASERVSWATTHRELPEEKMNLVSTHAFNPCNGEKIKIRQQPRLPEELMDASLTEGASQQSKFHLACVDGGHGRVAKSTNAQRGLQLHLSTSFSPQPADKGKVDC